MSIFPSFSFGRRLLLCTTVGGALGGWVGAWCVAAPVLVGSGWLFRSLELFTEVRAALPLSSHDYLEYVREAINFPIPTDPAYLALVFFCIGVVAGFSIGILTFIGRFDVLAAGPRSFLWAVGSFFRLPNIVAALIFPCVTLAAIPLVESDGLWPFAMVIGLILIAAFAATPILVIRRHVVEETAAAGWWNGPWPSGRTVVIFYGLVTGQILLGEAEGLFSDVSLFFSVPLSILLGLFSSVIALIAVCQLLFQKPILGCLHHKISWRTLSSWWSYSFCLLLVGLVLLGPVVFAYFILWKVVPVVAFVYEVNGQSLPILWLYSIAACNFIGRFYWLLFLIPGSFLYWLGAGRVVWLASAEEKGSWKDPIGIPMPTLNNARLTNRSSGH